MRVVYCDPGLQSNLGHHASSCRYISRELWARRVETRVFGHVQVDQSVKIELGAAPHFRGFTYWISDGDPICGWLNAYLRVAQVTHDDLRRLTGIEAGDLLYLNSGQAAQLLGLAQWAAANPAGSIPHIVFEFGVDPGLEIEINAHGAKLSIGDPRKNAKPVLFRHAACQIPKRLNDRFHLVTLEPNSSAAYRSLLGKDVGLLPMPRPAITPARCRAGKRPITVGVLGHQRTEKGYQLMPEITRRLFEERADINVLAHNGAPLEMQDTQQELRHLAASEARLRIDERLADERIWAELLEATDVVLCPYPTNRFATSYSAVAADAVANGIPIVAPRGSSMARLIADFGGAGSTFDTPDVASIVAATVRLLEHFDQHAETAARGAKQWNEINGPRQFVDSLLSLAKQTV